MLHGKHKSWQDVVASPKLGSRECTATKPRLTTKLCSGTRELHPQSGAARPPQRGHEVLSTHIHCSLQRRYIRPACNRDILVTISSANLLLWRIPSIHCRRVKSVWKVMLNDTRGCMWCPGVHCIAIAVRGDSIRCVHVGGRALTTQTFDVFDLTRR